MFFWLLLVIILRTVKRVMKNSRTVLSALVLHDKWKLTWVLLCCFFPLFLNQQTHFFSACHNILAWNCGHRNLFLIEQASTREKKNVSTVFVYLKKKVQIINDDHTMTSHRWMVARDFWETVEWESGTLHISSKKTVQLQLMPFSRPMEGTWRPATCQSSWILMKSP